MMELFTRLLLAHLLGDFVLQPSGWVQQKERRKAKAPLLYLHAAVHGLLTFLFTASLSPWNTALWVAGIHLAIDLLKLYGQQPESRTHWFLADQLLHLLSLAGITFFINTPSASQFQSWFTPHFWTMVTGVIGATFAASLIIQVLLQNWTDALGTGPEDSLVRAGKYIGMLERLLTFIFVLSNHWEAVGFLITAKSVFRFGDLQSRKEVKLTEYILVGTLLSFGIAIGVALLVRKSISG